MWGSGTKHLALHLKAEALSFLGWGVGGGSTKAVAKGTGKNALWGKEGHISGREEKTIMGLRS